LPDVPIDATKFDYAVSVWVPAAAKPQALEMEIQQQIHGLVFNWAAQADYASGQWRAFNFGLPGQGSWSNLAPFTPIPDSWFTIRLVAERTAALKARRTLFLNDGVIADVVLPSFREPDANLPKYPDQLSIGWQLDFMPAKGAYSVVTKDMT
jgi:hypothetical protein